MPTPPDDPPRGSRFSHVYLDRGEPTGDSVRMRRRLAALIDSFRDFEGLGPFVMAEHGVDVPSAAYIGYEWKKFLSDCALRDVLDLVTTGYRLLNNLRTFHEMYPQQRWLKETRRIFAEENVHYRIDDHGGVHFHFDEEFARSREAAVQVLRLPRYTNALHAFENGMAALGETPPNGKNAIRGVFAAAESVFRLILPNAPRLGVAELDGLSALLQKIYAQDDTARRASLKLLNSLKDWVDAAHFYRHEEAGEQAVAQPPLKLTVYIVSTGASHVRWLAELDTTVQQARP
jgi:hypothetical protein